MGYYSDFIILLYIFQHKIFFLLSEKRNKKKCVLIHDKHICLGGTPQPL